ncbi:hypothetical protein GCM10028803_40980 [Larkinella knui]|uniref:Response regulatory domain-containing protein n=1 Tax=Larkinella knui TaxID=2025310 RepID=A0A3P1CN20_9BACT|nr:hypothetical protein [Larkinella knui]RRB14731.1 hypothetical protein EHT87_09170 [Larkinella knui]
MTGPLSVLIVSTETPELHELEQSLRNYGVPHRHLPAEGKAALDFYFQQGLADAMFVPTLIMLDIDACEPEKILALLKPHPVLRRIPVIIFGHGNDPDRVKLVYSLGATCYMPKPPNWEAAMAPFCSYWKKHVALPAIKAEDISSSNSYSNLSNRTPY